MCSSMSACALSFDLIYAGAIYISPLFSHSSRRFRMPAVVNSFAIRSSFFLFGDAVRSDCPTRSGFHLRRGEPGDGAYLLLGRPDDESDVLEALRGRYTKQEMQKKEVDGLSFEDLIYAAKRMGFDAQGGKVPEVELVNLQGPVIVRLKKSERFQHFVVLRKVGDGVYYLSDPVVGQSTESYADFHAQYTGDALAIWRKGAPLPRAARLTSPRDGISVSNSLARAINGPQVSLQKGL